MFANWNGQENERPILKQIPLHVVYENVNSKE